MVSFFVHPSAPYGLHQAMFHQGWLSNCTKYHMLGYPLSTKMGCRSKRRVIHCFWSVSNPSWDAWDWHEELLIASIYQLLVPLNHFLPRLALKLHAKCHFLDTLPVQKMGCWTARRDIHCLWSASKPSLGTLCRCEDLPCASFRHLWVSPSCVQRRPTLKSLTKCNLGYPLNMQNWVLHCEERHP